MRRQPLKWLSIPAFNYIFALMFTDLMSGACTREQDNKAPIPQHAKESVVAVSMKKRQSPEGHKESISDGVGLDRKIRQWEPIQDAALANYDVCLENCGNSSECMDICEPAYVQALAAEYKILLDK